MKKKIFPLFMGVAALLCAVSCNDFLDQLPDNRTTLDSEQKIARMLTSCYPEVTHAMFTEYMSDYADDNGKTNPHTDRFFDQIWHWEDITEDNNDSPENFWNSSYAALAGANEALAAIEALEAEGRGSAFLSECKAEALLCRAYEAFMLVNVFSLNYNSATGSSDPGVPFPTEPQDGASAITDRGTVAGVYEQIDRDLREALPLVGDEHLDVPKYHFNKQAAYAFACRFYLYWEKWEEAEKWADMLLGSDPSSLLRDNEYAGSLPFDLDNMGRHYIDASLSCNLLLATSYSYIGLAVGPYYPYSRYSHNEYLASQEDVLAKNVWGKHPLFVTAYPYRLDNINMVVFIRSPFLVEYIDEIAGTGYFRSDSPLFTADECLLNRAEARILQGKYDAAVADLNLWCRNMVNNPDKLTAESIQNFYNGVDYSYDVDFKTGTVKKHLHPSFTIDKEGSLQECLLQCVLGFRRIEMLQSGHRWFDVKRYGIEIPRRVLDIEGNPSELVDILKKDDPRRAIQLPAKVIAAGMEANPR
jgi:hypothetical protein